MKPIERLFQYFEFKSIKPTRFERENGISNGYLSTQYRRKGDIGGKILTIIIENNPELNIEWLLTGKGNMLKNEAGDIGKDETNEKIPELNKTIKTEKTESKNSKQSEPDIEELYKNLNNMIESNNNLSRTVLHLTELLRKKELGDNKKK